MSVVLETNPISLDGYIVNKPKPEQAKGESILAPYIGEFRDQAANPPSNDPYIAACYTATLEMIEQNPDMETFFSDVVKSRDITPSHFVNLFLRGIQYLEINRYQREKYPEEFAEKDRWKQEIETILADKDAKPELSKLLKEKDTTTTIFQRYAGLAGVLNAIHPQDSNVIYTQNGLRVADFGCGGNLGLPGLVKGIPFKQIIDHTENQFVSQLLTRRVPIIEGLGVDKENPYDPDAIKWRRACSFYPGELNQLPNLIELEEKVKGASNVNVLQGDLLKLKVNHSDGTLPTKHFDAVHLATILYQMTEEQQAAILDSARESSNGLVVVQDFARKNPLNPRGLDFKGSWFKEPFAYRTMIASEETDWEMREIFQWKNGRCTEVRPGEDIKVLSHLRK